MMKLSFRQKNSHALQLFLTLAATACAAVAQAEPKCAHCGCHAQCQTVCRLVCEEKKVEVLCWGCKCEDFCVPGPCCLDCRHCETVCDNCDSCDPTVPYSEPKNFVWQSWLPSFAQTYTRTKLMRKTATVTVPSHKWVIEEMCGQCAAKFEHEEAPMVAELPPTPDRETSKR